MNNIAEMMNNIADDLSNAYSDGLRDGAPKWIKTADRVPGYDEHEPIMAVYENAENGFMLHEIIETEWLRMNPAMYPYWLPLPPLPETAGAEGTKTEEKARPAGQ